MSKTDTAVHDYVIVGSGAGGSVLAERLSRDPDVSVLVLEAGGGDRHPMHLVPKGVRFAMSNPRYTKTYHPEPFASHGRPELWKRGRIIGGSTTLNGMVWNRGWSPQYDAFEQAGNPGWGWERFLEAFKAIESHQLGASDVRGGSGPVAISVAAPPEDVSETFIRTVEQHGVRRVDDLNSCGDDRVAYVTSNIRRGTRVSAARAFLRRARRRRNVTVIDRCEAQRILFDGTTATGVEATRKGRTVTFTARREVLVCGGGLESPMLLERSGVGDPAVLAAAGIPLVAASPKVGENLLDHRSILFRPRLKGRVGFNAQVDSPLKQAWAGFKYLFTRRGIISFGGYNVMVIFTADPASPYPDVQGVFTPLSVSDVTSGSPVVDKTSGAMFLTYALFPTSTGSIHVTGPTVDDTPRIVAGVLDTEADRAVAVRMVRRSLEILATPPFADLIEEVVEPAQPLDTDQQIVDYLVDHGGHGYHTLGTCAMGPDADDVVDERLRVRGTSGLRVVDASVFPSMPSGNNNGPTQALAWIAADLVLEDARLLQQAR